MTLEDVPGVMEIEGRSFPTPWSESSFRYELLENPYASLFVIRAAASPRVLGFACVWVIDEEMKINNIAVHPDHRGRGLGRRLLRFLLDFARAEACREVTLEVRPSNVAALRLYARAGFRTVGRRRNYYTDTHEDALVMACPVGPGGPPGSRLAPPETEC
jgi:ribosomal-protein-alanine N-acetyltransferase